MDKSSLILKCVIILLGITLITPLVLGGPNSSISITPSGLTNQSDYIVNWSSPGGQSFRLEKNGEIDISCTQLLNETYEDEDDGTYTFRVRAYGDFSCGWEDGDEGNWSDSVSVTVDTTPPSLISRSPGSGEVDVRDSVDIVMEFEEENEVNETYTQNSFKLKEVGGPEIVGSFDWEGDKLTFSPDNDLEYGEEYEVSVQPKDEVGNTGEEYTWSFETSVLPDKIDIRDPDEGSSFLIDEDIIIEVKVTGNGKPMLGGTVTATGAGSSEDLTEQEDGIYRTTSFTLQESGTQTITIKAENRDIEKTDTVDIEVGAWKTIGVNIIKPENKTFTRGDEIPFELQPTLEGEPSEDLELSSPQIEFDQEDSTTYTGTLKTTPTDEQDKTIEIIVKGEVQDRDREEITPINLELKPIELDVNIKYTVDGEPVDILKGGDDVKVRLEIKYPDGEPVTNIEIKEGKLFQVREYDDEENTLNFTHEGSGIHTTRDTYTVSGRHIKYRTLLEIEDPYENYWSGEPTIEGPAGALKFYMLTPRQIDGDKLSEIPLEASQGQTITITGKVKRDEEAQIPESVELNGEPFERDGETYSIDYTVPKTDEDEVTITYTIQEGETPYNQTQTIKLIPPKVHLNQEELKEHGITKGEKFEVPITYPTDETVTEGNFELEIGQQTYQMEYNSETGRWQTKEPIDLGTDPLTTAVMVKGQDTHGNQIISEQASGIEYHPALTVLDYLTNLILLGMIAAIIIALIVCITYYKKRHVPKKEFQKKLDKLIHLFDKMDNAYRSYSKTRDREELKSRQGDIKSQQKEVRDKIKNYVEKHPFLTKVQRKKAREIADKNVRRALSFYTDKELEGRLWYMGLRNNQEPKEIHRNTMDKYAETVNQMKEQDLDRDEIEEKLKEEHDFNKSRAKTLLRYTERRNRIIKDIKKKLKQEEPIEEIKEQVKNKLKTKDEQFKEYRAQKLIKEAKTGEKARKQKKITPKKKPKDKEKEKKQKEPKSPESVENPAIQRMKQVMKELQELGRSKQQIKRDISEQAQEIGLPQRKIDKLLEDLED